MYNEALHLMQRIPKGALEVESTPPICFDKKIHIKFKTYYETNDVHITGTKQKLTYLITYLAQSDNVFRNNIESAQYIKEYSLNIDGSYRTAEDRCKLMWEIISNQLTNTDHFQLILGCIKRHIPECVGIHLLKASPGLELNNSHNFWWMVGGIPTEVCIGSIFKMLDRYKLTLDEFLFDDDVEIVLSSKRRVLNRLLKSSKVSLNKKLKKQSSKLLKQTSTKNYNYLEDSLW